MYRAPENRLTTLFEQLGLDPDPQAIAQFIAQHALAPGQNILDAPFWNDSQRAFLRSAIETDAEWAVVVDSLAVSLAKSKS